jgi:hypothetical protein
MDWFRASLDPLCFFAFTWYVTLNHTNVIRAKNAIVFLPVHAVDTAVLTSTTVSVTVVTPRLLLQSQSPTSRDFIPEGGQVQGLQPKYLFTACISYYL